MIFDVIKLVIGGFIGFISALIVQRLLQKRVKLIHDLLPPTVYSTILPQLSFQNLQIKNIGNAPATKIKVMFKRSVFNDAVAIGVANGEKYNTIESDDVLTLEFERLLPKEVLVISFKSSEPLQSGFLMRVKSDEVISEVSTRGSSRILDWLSTILVLVAVIMVGYSIYKSNIQPKKIKTNSPIILSLSFQKTSCSPGDSIIVEYSANNPGPEILRGVSCTLVAPGFYINSNPPNHGIDFFRGGSKLNWRGVIFINKDVPVGSYSLSLIAMGYIKNQSFAESMDTSFIVK